MRKIAYERFDLSLYRGGSSRSFTSSHQEQPTFKQHTISTSEPAPPHFFSESGTQVSEPSHAEKNSHNGFQAKDEPEVILGFKHNFGPENDLQPSSGTQGNLINFECEIKSD